MAQSSPALPGTLTTADGIPLKLSLQRAQRRNRRHAFFLVAPLLAFIAVTFLLPIGDMLLRSVQNPELVSYMPRTLAVLKDWDGQEVPGEEAFAALADAAPPGKRDATDRRRRKALKAGRKAAKRGGYHVV